MSTRERGGERNSRLKFQWKTDCESGKFSAESVRHDGMWAFFPVGRVCVPFPPLLGSCSPHCGLAFLLGARVSVSFVCARATSVLCISRRESSTRISAAVAEEKKLVAIAAVDKFFPGGGRLHHAYDKQRRERPSSFATVSDICDFVSQGAATQTRSPQNGMWGRTAHGPHGQPQGFESEAKKKGGILGIVHQESHRLLYTPPVLLNFFANHRQNCP